MNTKAQVKELVLEKLAQVKGLEGLTELEEARVDAFLESFEKTAAEQGAFWENPEVQALKPANSYDFGEEMKRGGANALASAGVGAVASGALYMLGKWIQSGNKSGQHAKFLEALKQAIQGNPILEEAARTKKDKLLSYAESIFKVAPNMASDPNLLSHILSVYIQGEGIDLVTLKSLSDLESRHSGNNTLDVRSFK